MLVKIWLIAINFELVLNNKENISKTLIASTKIVVIERVSTNILTHPGVP